MHIPDELLKTIYYEDRETAITLMLLEHCLQSKKDEKTTSKDIETLYTEISTLSSVILDKMINNTKHKTLDQLQQKIKHMVAEIHPQSLHPSGSSNLMSTGCLISLPAESHENTGMIRKTLKN